MENSDAGRGLKITAICLWAFAFILPLLVALSSDMTANAVMEGIFGPMIAMSFVVVAFEKLFSRKSAGKRKTLYYLIWGILMICMSFATIGETRDKIDAQQQIDKTGK